MTICLCDGLEQDYFPYLTSLQGLNVGLGNGLDRLKDPRQDEDTDDDDDDDDDDDAPREMDVQHELPAAPLLHHVRAVNLRSDRVIHQYHLIIIHLL